ncbi:PIN domain-containing protein [Candidatus Albibeggiatoa sp. nov. BB20]|uniref:PIN domain-containing protein n=1 Tax=Candidatus Albibeggiatoa sp. nov. BB20 TaxID=3162723 RepID=UPI003365A4E3
MNAKVFVDTNIFVYAKLFNAKEKLKYQKAVSFFNNQTNQVIISTQVLNEFSNVLLRHKVTDNAIIAAVNEIAQVTKVSPLTLETVQKAWQIKQQYHFSYWDSLIISAALLENCETLFTEDLQHGQLIEKQLVIQNPLI